MESPSPATSRETICKEKRGNRAKDTCLKDISSEELDPRDDSCGISEKKTSVVTKANSSMEFLKGKAFCQMRMECTKDISAKE